MRQDLTETQESQPSSLDVEDVTRTLPQGAVWVATDRSVEGIPALKQAHDLAVLRNVPLVVCHVLPEFDAIRPLMPQFAGTVVPSRDHQPAFTAIATEVRHHTGRGDDDFFIVLEFGRASSVIAELARVHDPMLVVVGKSTKRATTRLLVDSTVDEIIRLTPSPVLMARTSPRRGPVLAAIDLSPASESVLMTAFLEAERKDVPLWVVHSVEETPGVAADLAPEAAVDANHLLDAQREATEFIDARLAALGSNAKVRVTVGPPIASVTWCAKQQGASLVIVSTPRTRGSEPGDIVTGIVRESPCSVLVVRE